MTSFPKPAVKVKVEHNTSFSDHDYCYKQVALNEMDEEHRSFFVDVENDEEMDEYNGRLRKRRNVKQPEYFMIKSNNSSGRKATKTKPRKSTGQRGDEAKFEVEYIWGKRMDKTRPGKLEYRVYWKGYPIQESSWEPEDNLRLCQESIDRYEQREMYFNEKGDKEMHSKMTKHGVAASEAKIQVVVVNRAKPLKHVLPTMRAPHVVSSSTSSVMSIPPLPKQKNMDKLPTRNKLKASTKRSSPSSSPQASDAPLIGAKKRKMSITSLLNGTSSGTSFPRSSNGNKKEFIGETVPKTIDELAVKLQAKSVEEILSHESCDIEGVPFVFTVRYGDGSVKRVIMRDLVDIAPRLLSFYLAVALKRAEGSDN